MDTIEMLESSLSWGKENFGGSESLISDKDLSTIWKLIILFTCVIFLGFKLGLLVVVDNVAHFFLDVLNDFDFSVGGKAIASLVQDFLEVSGDVSTSQMNSLNSVRYGITLINWDSVGNTITRVEDDTGSSTIRVKCEN